MIRQAKKQCFHNLNTNDVADNKTFWKTVNPLLTDKVKTKSIKTLIEKKYKDNSTKYSEQIIWDDKVVAEVFNKFFLNIVPDLKIPASHNCNKDFQKTNDPVLNAINKYKHHPRIVMIKYKIDTQNSFILPQCNMKMSLEKLKV